MTDAIKNTAKIFADRIDNANRNFDEVLMELGGIDRADAIKVRKVLFNAKFAKFESGMDRISVVHGALLEKDFIRHCLNKAIDNPDLMR